MCQFTQIWKVTTKKWSSYRDCKICFRVECCVWEQFSLKTFGLPLDHTSHVLLSKANHRVCWLITERLHYITTAWMTATRWSTFNQRWSAIKKRQSQKKNKHHDAIYHLPSFFFLNNNCDNISEFQQSSSQEPSNFAILGPDLLPTWCWAHLSVSGAHFPLSSPTRLTIVGLSASDPPPCSQIEEKTGVCDSFNY